MARSEFIPQNFNGCQILLNSASRHQPPAISELKIASG